MNNEKLVGDKEFNEKVEAVCSEFVGDLDDLYAIVGMMVVGRLYGWHVMRLVARRGHWGLAAKYFGDPKKWMRTREKYWERSVGIRIVDGVGKYWDFIRGKESIDHSKRKMVM